MARLSIKLPKETTAIREAQGRYAESVGSQRNSTQNHRVSGEQARQLTGAALV
jgi:hypothetical protein